MKPCKNYKVSCKNYKVSCKNYKILHFVCLTRAKARKKKRLYIFIFFSFSFSEFFAPGTKKSPRVRKNLPACENFSPSRTFTLKSASILRKKRRPRALPFLYITAYNIHDMLLYHFPKGGRQHYSGGLSFLLIFSPLSSPDINASATPRRQLHPFLLLAFRMPA